MPKNLPKVVVVLGATATGKTDLGIALAKKFNGEVISADSRQVFKKMQIGTVKPPGTWKKLGAGKAYMVEGVPHYCMDIIDPGTELSMADFKSLAIAHINDIVARGKVPFIVGGTGLYIWSVVDNLNIPKIAPHKKLRRSLEKKSLIELQNLLKKMDSDTYNSIDIKNPRRLIRALEVAIMSGESLSKLRNNKPEPLFETLQIGIQRPIEELYQRINNRAEKLIEQGWIEETRNLLKQKYTWNLPSMSSLGYKQIGDYLREEKSLEDAIAGIKRDTRHYARRQITWFKRDKRIHWIDGKNMAEPEKLVREFLEG